MHNLAFRQRADLPFYLARNSGRTAAGCDREQRGLSINLDPASGHGRARDRMAMLRQPYRVFVCAGTNWDIFKCEHECLEFFPVVLADDDPLNVPELAELIDPQAAI